MPKLRITKFAGNIQRLRAPDGYILRIKSIGYQSADHIDVHDILFSVVKEPKGE